MPDLKTLALSAFAAALFSVLPTAAHAQLSISIGAQPVCPYGYYDYAPYNCSPYGYYGPDWFNSGLFVGAGPWFHGDRGFYGHVDNRYDPNYGYRGPFPDRGDRPFDHFHGNEARDGRGHIGRADHGAGNEHFAGAQGFRGVPRGGGGGFHGGRHR